MQTSERFGFVLPSRDAPDDIADINQISDNFRIIDNKMVEREDGKGLSTNDYTTQEKRKLEKLSENGISATANDGDKEYYSAFDAQPTRASIYSSEVGDTANATEFRVEKDKITLVGIVDAQENNPVAFYGIKTPDGTDPTQAVNVAYINNLPQNVSNVAPAIPNTASGTAIAITDISPIEHTLGVKARVINLYDETAYPLTNGYVRYDTGAVVEHTNYICTKDYVPCSHLQGEIITINKHNTGGTYVGLAWYDASKSYISGIQGASGYTAITVPSNAVYLRFTVDAGTSEVQLELGPTSTPYKPFADISTAKVIVNNDKTYLINADGTVEGVTSLYPTTTLIPDTEGIVLDVEYYADTKKYIDNKFAELAALIVNS